MRTGGLKISKHKEHVRSSASILQKNSQINWSCLICEYTCRSAKVWNKQNKWLFWFMQIEWSFYNRRKIGYFEIFFIRNWSSLTRHFWLWCDLIWIETTNDFGWIEMILFLSFSLELISRNEFGFIIAGGWRVQCFHYRFCEHEVS